ncbi:MAG: glutamate--tRNA ligase [Gracilibacteraceae bacterium]|jgi:glutamyl-tRNA synthetase|nr:glutamate--tRNA ligase [Gracilibacteraceae bacterium]
MTEQAKLAALLFPNSGRSIADYEALYPPRPLPAGAPVTRLAPSPTGFIHLGNLYGAFADERLAHQNGGLFFLRIEDTDEKRETAGAAEALIGALDYFGLRFDEGVTAGGETGAYGPYRQRRRAELYRDVARELTARGLAYPCFCTEDELGEIRASQEAAGANFGYYGLWARHRNLAPGEIERRVGRGEPFTLRWRAPAAAAAVTVQDGIRGRLVLPGNEQDIVLLKSNGIPTYHFAHVVDDHFMRTTHVLRGEEWLSSLPVHVQIFAALGWEHPFYCHTPLLLKAEAGGKRKLSKRKDPELGLDFYRREGYHPRAVREYLLTLLNSDYEEWRLGHPTAPMEEFPFSLARMGSSGALFDLQKLNDVSKNVLAALPPGETADFLRHWAGDWQPEAAAVWTAEREYLAAIVAIGRREANPRKDLVYGTQIFSFLRFFFDPLFTIEDALPDNVGATEARGLLAQYSARYDHAADKESWFAALKRLAAENGYAEKPRDYKKQPELYKGHVGDVSAVIRLALSGRKNSPDLWEVQQVMGEDRVRRRLEAMIQYVGQL